MSFEVSALTNDQLIPDAIRQGYVISLQIYLTQNPQYVNRFYRTNQCYWTPLLAACFYKQEQIVRMLLKCFSVDIEARGTIVFDIPTNNPERVEDVSALWTAAAVNHFDLVRLLIEQGKANVNHLTKTHSTTFRVACYNNNLDMMKYLVEHGADPQQRKLGNYTNLMLSAGRGFLTPVKYLIEDLHVDINECDENGQGALYYGVKSGLVEIVEFLLEHGARNERDTLRNVTPLMRAALYGKIELVEAFSGYCSDLEWIEGKELLAATFAGWITHIEDLNKTIRFLTEAFQLREDKEMKKVVVVPPSDLFNQRSECLTLDEFNQLINLKSKHELLIETIRIHYRLLGEKSNDYHYVLRYYGAFLADENRYVDCCYWWLYEFELKQKWNGNIDEEHLRWLLAILNEIQSDQWTEIPWQILQRTLKVIDFDVRMSRSREDFDYRLHTLLYMITNVAEILHKSQTNDESESSKIAREQLFQLGRTIVRRNYRTKKSAAFLLHLCCDATMADAFGSVGTVYPCSITVQFLLDCDAQVDVFDQQKNTPLHLLLKDPSKIDVFRIIDLFHRHAAHVDYRNIKGQTALQLIPDDRHDVVQYFQRKINVYPLKCLCAHLILEQKLTYQSCLSMSLVHFLQKH